MLTLVPNEHWDYRSTDALRGLTTAMTQRGTGAAVVIPGLGRCLPVRSARAAIVLALKCLALRRGAQVGVPLYCCPVVFKAIEAAGCRPRFIDIEPATYCLSFDDTVRKGADLEAVVAVHMFGNLCDIPRLREAVSGKPFIEDCAQALGSKLDGRLAGSFGEIAAFSFRSGKYLSVGEGGALYAHNPVIASRLSRLVDGFPVPGRVQEAVHVVKTYVRSALRRRPLWGLIGSRVWDVYLAKVSHTDQSPLIVGRAYETDRALAVRRLRFLSSSIGMQRANAQFYSQHLAVGAHMLSAEPPRAFYNRLQYPVLLDTSEQCDRLAARLRERGISTTRPYKDIAAVAATHFGYTGDCPVAESVARRVLVVPCHHALKQADVERVASCVNDAWARVAGRERAHVAVAGSFSA